MAQAQVEKTGLKRMNNCGMSMLGRNCREWLEKATNVEILLLNTAHGTMVVFKD